MPGFNGLYEIIEADDLGKNHYSSYRKNPNAGTVAGAWFDMSMSPGFPSPQYYAASPLTAQQMKKSTDGGFNHGPDVSPSYKFLKKFNILSLSGTTAAPMPFILCDYLLYYPFVDTGTTDEQTLTNGVSLPRYTTGEGVQAMLVSVAPMSGTNPTFTLNYTNSEGVSGRTSRTHTIGAQTANGSIMIQGTTSTSTRQPFVGLQDGDKGIRSVESITFSGSPDSGLLALALVRPLLTSTYYEIPAPSEIVPLNNQSTAIRIYDDAFLGLVCLPNGSVNNSNFIGEIETFWN